MCVIVIFGPDAVTVKGQLSAPLSAFNCAAICAADVVVLVELLAVNGIVYALPSILTTKFSSAGVPILSTVISLPDSDIVNPVLPSATIA